MTAWPGIGVTPYYEDDAVQIYHGDAFDILPLIRDHGPQIDLIVTDPDYNSPYMLYESESTKLTEDEYKAFCASWFNLAQSITPNVVFTPGQTNVWNYPKPRWVAAWHKSSSASKSRIGGFAVWEPILIYGDMKCRFGHDYLNYNPLNFHTAEWTLHPCPKNPECWKSIVHRIDGDMVLDPFLGSGTTCRVAKDLGKRSIGIEREERYCEIAANRMAQGVLL